MSGGSDLTIRVSALKFTHRELRSEDLAECFGFDATHMGNELVGFSKALEVWKRQAGSRALRGIAIEAKSAACGSATCGLWRPRVRCTRFCRFGD
jgi:hypothetical protein